MQKCSVICSCFGIPLSSAYENSRGFQPVDAQTVAREAALHERVELIRVRQCAVEPEVRRDVLFRVLSVRIPPFGHALDGTDHGLPGLLNQTGMLDRERRRKVPSGNSYRHGRAKHQNSFPGIVVHAALDFAERAGDRVQVLDASAEPDHHFSANHSTSLAETAGGRGRPPPTPAAGCHVDDVNIPQALAFGD